MRIKIQTNTQAPYAAYDFIIHRGGHVWTAIEHLAGECNLQDLCDTLAASQVRHPVPYTGPTLTELFADMKRP